jgi:hypothetical protein
MWAGLRDFIALIYTEWHYRKNLYSLHDWKKKSTSPFLFDWKVWWKIPLKWWPFLEMAALLALINSFLIGCRALPVMDNGYRSGQSLRTFYSFIFMDKVWAQILTSFKFSLVIIV